MVTLMTFASAAVNFVNVIGNNQSVTVGKTATISFKLQESDYGNLTNMSFNVPLTLNYTTYSFASQTAVTGMVTSLNQDQVSGTMSLSFAVPATQQPGIYTGTLILSGNYIAPVTYNLPITLRVFSEAEPEEISECKLTGNKGDNLKLDIDDIKVTKGFGDDTTWSPLDEIQVKVNVENKGDEDIKDITIGWGLYNKDTEELIIDDEENDFNLDSDEDKTITITFKLDDPSAFKDEGDYVFFVWANAEDKEFEDTDSDTCAYVSDDTVEVTVEDSFVMLDSLEVLGTVSCGDTVQLTGTLWNFGEDDETDVVVVVQNKDLGINSKVQIGDVDSFDSKDFLFDLKIPSNSEIDKTYEIELSVLDEDGEVFQNENDDYSKTFISIKPESGCTNEPEASIFANLESEKVEAGKEFVVKAKIKNDGSTSKTFDLSVEGYTDWASLVSLDKDTLEIEAGKSEEVLVKFSVNEGVSGSQNFNFVLVDEKDRILTQPVSVSVEKANVFGGFTGAFLGGDNWYIWGIGALNVILIIVIIIVAVRVMRK